MYYEVRGSAAANIVKEVEIRRSRFTGEPWNTWHEVHLVSVSYTNQNTIPILTLAFYPKN